MKHTMYVDFVGSKAYGAYRYYFVIDILQRCMDHNLKVEDVRWNNSAKSRYSIEIFDGHNIVEIQVLLHESTDEEDPTIACIEDTTFYSYLQLVEYVYNFIMEYCGGSEDG